MPGELVAIFGVIGVFGGGVAVVWIIARAFTQRSRARKDELDSLLQRFDSAEEFTRFAETPAGRELVESITSGRRDSGNQVTKSVHRGLVVGFLGVGFLIVSFTHEPDLAIPAWILIGLGAGFLISAYVTNRLQEKDDDPESPVPEEFTPA